MTRKTVSRVLVTGSRDLRNRDIVRWALGKAYRYKGVPTLIHGGCPTGADKYAHEWAYSLYLPIEVYEADWTTHGKAAGPIRNSEMVKAGADICLAFPIGTSVGTWDCINKAKRAGIRTIIFKGFK